MKKIRKAIIPAAGFGTRFLPATKAQPKEMIPVVDKPTLQYIVEEVIGAGIEEILIITNRNKHAIEDHFDRSVELELLLERSGKTELLAEVRDISELVRIHYVRQMEARGLGHAILCGKAFIGDEPFAVLLGDDIVDSKVPCIGQLMKSYEQYGGTILGVQSVPETETDKYGIVSGEALDDHTYRVNTLVEKPAFGTAPSNVAILGRYIISPDIFEILENTPPGKGNEIQLTDALNQLAHQQSVYAHIFEGRRYDVGSKIGYLEATLDYALKRDELREPLLAYMKKIIG